MAFKKGYIPWNKGKTIPEEIKKRMYKFPKGHKINLGRKQTQEHKRKVSIARKGHIGYWKGKTLSEEHKRNIFMSNINKIMPVKDTSIEVKIQNFLQQLNIDFVKHKPIINIEHP